MRYLLMLAMLLGAMSAYAGDSQDQGDGRRGDDRSGPPKVYDAQGKYVGRLETNSNQDGVFLTINGAVTFRSQPGVHSGHHLPAHADVS
jgi:hypothetical protein